MFQKALETGETQLSEEKIDISHSGTKQPYSLSVSPFPDDYNDGLLVIFRDLTDFTSARDKLAAAHCHIDNLTGEANKDALTQLWNRRYVENYLIPTFTKTKNLKSRFIALMDIDFFKDINDTYGHDIGDEVLVFFAKLTQKTFRSTDIIARWGGEEFLVILNQISDTSAFRALEAFRQKIESTYIAAASHDLRITVTIGYAWCGDSEDFNQTLKKSDAALYYGKRHGRNVVVKYKPGDSGT
jgi:diguanylate cyclase (GGDEF)-like protein